MHRPGRELARMTPSTRDYFLFDDLLFDEHAQEEHDWLVDILQNHLGVKVHLFENLFTEALANASRRGAAKTDHASDAAGAGHAARRTARGPA